MLFVVGHPMCFYGIMSLEKYSAQIRYTGLFKSYLRQLQNIIYDDEKITNKCNHIIFEHLQEKESFTMILFLIVVVFLFILFLTCVCENKYIMLLLMPILSFFLMYMASIFANKYTNTMYNKEVLPMLNQIHYTILSHSHNDEKKDLTKELINKNILRLSSPYKHNDSLQKRIRLFSKELYFIYNQEYDDTNKNQ